MTVLVVLGILVLILIFLIGMYNALVRLKVQVDNAWADIDVQLKRRYDLIPNLVETVKGYAAHEKGTLEAVINARNRAMTATSPADKAQAENMLSGALKSLFALSEAYPQLRAIESFTSLQASLTQIEDNVQNARRYYNAVVRDLNTKIQQYEMGYRMQTAVPELTDLSKEPEDIIGENGLLKQLTKAILERAMHAELTEHLGYEKHDIAGHNSGNSRNGSTRKKLLGDFGELELETPRDRQSSFEPRIVAKGQTRFTGFDDKIISMYAPRHERTRDPRPSRGDLRHRRFAGSDLAVTDPA